MQWPPAGTGPRRLFAALSALALASTSSVCIVFLFWMGFDREERGANLLLYDTNNFFENVGVLVARDRHRDVPAGELKTILMWNGAYDSTKIYDNMRHGREAFYEFLCPETRCLTTSNRTLLKSVADYDAIVIHQRGIRWQDLPTVRSSKQRWIMWVVESAQYPYMDVSRIDGMFNWTFTYRRDADFFRPYGVVARVRPHREDPEELRRHIRRFGARNAARLAGNRTGTESMAAWFVSNCHTRSGRENIAAALASHMTVHVYGSCGNFVCKRNDTSTECQEMLEAKYRFYLSFENSVCEDYITEKFFNRLRFNVIPVVLGGANYSLFAPPHSYIDASWFPTAKDLARYLHSLAEDDAKFAEFFWWKEFYEVRDRQGDKAQPYCALCGRLNDPAAPPKTYEDMKDWWVDKSNCVHLKDFGERLVGAGFMEDEIAPFVSVPKNKKKQAK